MVDQFFNQFVAGFRVKGSSGNATMDMVADHLGPYTAKRSGY
jgi:hypothetical protein